LSMSKIPNMYLHIGQGYVLRHSEILGIFDMDNASWAYKTREFLERAENEGRVVWSCDDLPVSFILADLGDGEPIIYLSQLSSATLMSRMERNSYE